VSEWLKIAGEPTSHWMLQWLVIEEAAFVRAQFKDILCQKPVRIVDARDVNGAVEILSRDSQIDAIICDVNLMRMSGLLLRESVLRDNGTRIPIYLLANEAPVALLDDASYFMVAGWLSKPPVEAELLAMISQQIKVSTKSTT
jgi:CheY-like chemotaxis protein